MSTVIPYSVQQTLGSCCSHVTRNWRQHVVLTLPTGLYFRASGTTLGRSPVLQQDKCRSLISAMTIVKTLLRWDKCVRVLWDYVKK